MKLINFFQTVGKLKTLKRAGWVKRNIPNPESVAEHSFRTAIMAMVLAPKVDADVNKCVKMALIHDLGEAKIGDLIIMEGKKVLPNASEKKKIEEKAFKQIMQEINGKEYIKIFQEFEDNITKEARLVKELDKLEMAMQAYEYEKQYQINLEEWFENSRTLIVSKEIEEILGAIEKLRIETVNVS
jgi:putative hydrolases of HD superfamily